MRLSFVTPLALGLLTGCTVLGGSRPELTIQAPIEEKELWALVVDQTDPDHGDGSVVYIVRLQEPDGRWLKHSASSSCAARGQEPVMRNGDTEIRVIRVDTTG